MCCPASLICGGELLYFRHMCVNVLFWQALFVGECYYISALCVNVLSGKPYLRGSATIFPPCVCECVVRASPVCEGVLLYFRPVCECVVLVDPIHEVIYTCGIYVPDAVASLS